MFYSPVPLMVIRSDTEALIELNGSIVGECSAERCVAAPISDSGDYYICAIPLNPLERHYAVTRKISFENGTLTPNIAEDVSVCAWPGGIYELCVRTGSLPARPSSGFGQTIETIEWAESTLTLYYENELRIYAEQGGLPLFTYTLGAGRSGELRVLGDFLAVKAELTGAERLMLLNTSFEPVLDITADEIQLENNVPSAIYRMDTLMRHETRVRYRHEDDTFTPLAPETGFFTHAYSPPKDTLSLAIAFFEAVREGFKAEALRYLTPALQKTVSFEDIRYFLGNYTAVRPPLSDMSGKYIGLIASEGERISSARLYELEFEGMLITNISEE